MKIVKPSHEILFMPDGETILKNIELAGRTCYKSENKITPDSASGFVKRIIKSGHHSVLEHMTISVRFICDRGISHELVRHRHAAYSQESTRYVNQKDGITIIKPCFFPEIKTGEYEDASGIWRNKEHRVLPNNDYRDHHVFDYVTDTGYAWIKAMLQAESTYKYMVGCGSRPEEARSVLPNSLKTEVVMSTNLREWKHVLNLRCSKAAHPQIREIMLPLLKEFHEKIPAVFDDEYEKYLATDPPIITDADKAANLTWINDLSVEKDERDFTVHIETRGGKADEE